MNRPIELFARFALTLLFALVLLYFVISVCIVFFKATGVLVDGPMYFDFQTPSYVALFLFQLACVPVLLGTAWLRSKLIPRRLSGNGAPN